MGAGTSGHSIDCGSHQGDRTRPGGGRRGPRRARCPAHNRLWAVRKTEVSRAEHPRRPCGSYWRSGCSRRERWASHTPAAQCSHRLGGTCHSCMIRTPHGAKWTTVFRADHLGYVQSPPTAGCEAKRRKDCQLVQRRMLRRRTARARAVFSAASTWAVERAGRAVRPHWSDATERSRRNPGDELHFPHAQ